ncbi:MAG: hypothetical protein WCX61_04730 [Candidatus Peribacteraceae bacterium]|jgi:hypothetical protein
MQLPPPLSWIWKGWMAFSHALGMVMSKVILTVLWLLVFSIYGIAVKIIAIKKLWQKPAKTYWIDPPEDAGMQYQF